MAPRRPPLPELTAEARNPDLSGHLLVAAPRTAGRVEVEAAGVGEERDELEAALGAHRLMEDISAPGRGPLSRAGGRVSARR